MRALVVGLGSIGRRHARNWASLGLGPLAVCRQTGSPLPEPLGVDAREYHDLYQALESERPDIVFVTNPTSLHVETACAALRAGAHVLIEKPIGHTLHGVADMLCGAHQQKTLVMVGYNLRFHPGLVRLRELLLAGAAGRVTSARASMGEYLPAWHPWEDYRQSYSGRRELGGGAVLTFSHELDSLCWLLGTPRRLTAMASRASSLEIDVEDVAELVLEFPRGALGSIHVDFVRRPSHRGIEIIGEDGVLRWDYERNGVSHFTASSQQWRVEEGDPTFERNDMYIAELRHFVACVRGEVDRPLVDGEQGAAILAISLAALRSSAEGRTIDLFKEGEPVATWLRTLGAR